MRRVVHLHIGAPKTGTTYVQDRLSLNAGELAKHGVTYPGRTLRDASTFHFRAALDLLDAGLGRNRGTRRWRLEPDGSQGAQATRKRRDQS